MQILLADDHSLVREALKAYLGKPETGIDVASAASLDGALDVAAREEEIDLAILDLRMPGMDGLSGLDRFRAAFPDIPVAIMSGLATDEDVKQALEKGAVGFFPKTLTGQALVNAIKLVLAGERFIPYDVSALALPPELTEKKKEPTEKALAVGLSPRESAVLAHLLQGQSNKEIARHLDLQEVTIKLHMRSICRKLEVKNRTQAALRAREIGLDTLVAAESPAPAAPGLH